MTILIPLLDELSMLRERYPAAWAFHHNTIRWPFNTIEPDDEPWVGPAFKEDAGAPLIALPVSRQLSLSLGDAIRSRITCRSFAPSPLAIDDLATLLDAAYGVEGEVSFGSQQHLERPVPSGGGLYPLELYVIAQRVTGLAPGIYHYAPLQPALEQVRLGEYSAAVVSQLFMNQPYLADAASIIVFTAVADRSMHKYGDRGYRYILFECGHAAQNLCLAAAAMELGALPIGGFFDGFLAELLAVDLDREVILYGMGIGPSSTPASDRVARRNIGAFVTGAT